MRVSLYRLSAAVLALALLVVPGALECQSIELETVDCPMAAAMQGAPCHESAPEPMECCAFRPAPEGHRGVTAELAAAPAPAKLESRRPVAAIAVLTAGAAGSAARPAPDAAPSRPLSDAPRL